MRTQSRKHLSARLWGQRANASKYVRHVNDQPTPIKVILVNRESTPAQADHLPRQAANLRDAATRLGINIVGEVSRIWPGSDPIWLARAVALAEQTGATALLAESVDRFVRHPAFSLKHKNKSQPRDTDFEGLLWVTGDLTLLTLIHPDTDPDAVMSQQTKRIGCNPGRPARAKRSEEQNQLLADVLKCWRNLVGGKGL